MPSEGRAYNSSKKTAEKDSIKAYPAEQKSLLGLKIATGNRSTLDMIKELLYSTKKPLYELFREVATGDLLDADGFCKLVSKYSNQVLSEADTKAAFSGLCRENQSASDPSKEFLKW